MVSAIGYGLLIVTIPVSVIVATLVFQVFAACLFKRRPLEPAGMRPSIAVIVPAHNEALVLADTLQSVLPQLAAGDRLLLVADNCSDDTARIAVAAGVEVIERFDPDRRGKGYALDFGVRHLASNPPEVVIVIDADCRVGDRAVDRLARTCAETGRPVQGLYLMASPREADMRNRVAEFAWLVKNQVRPLGFLRVHLPCQLMGTGMAFPWTTISNAALASGHIVEDLKLGVDLARTGKPPLFCPEALVTSVFPRSAEGSQIQRTRWEHGHLGMIVREAPVILAEALMRRNLQLLALALDLSVPPLALLMLIAFVLFGVGAGLFASGGSAIPLAIEGAVLLAMVAAILLAWWRFGRHVLTLQDLTYAPVYALRKIPTIYLRFLRRRQLEWVRSRRDEH